MCAGWFVIVACLAKSWRMCGFFDFDKGLLSRNLCCLLVVRFYLNYKEITHRAGTDPGSVLHVRK